MENCSFFLFLFVISLLMMDFVYSSSVENSLKILKSRYGEGYGTEWIYFPDGDGNLHNISLIHEEEPHNLMSSYCQTDEKCPNDEIEFRLYNRNDTTFILLDEEARAVHATEQAIATEILHSRIPLKLITHGWQSSADIENILKIKDAYFEIQNVNVITVDWSVTASNIIYSVTARRTQSVGTQVASFLDALYEEYNIRGDQLHLIGHSLGAHVMGMAASKTNLSVHRVTGLDPAGPFFEVPANPSAKLNSSVAEIVDVIHTCAGHLGVHNAIGTVDFFPNEGSPPQPGCGTIFSDMFTACSHSISYRYFLVSITNSTMYQAFECASWQHFLDHRCNETGYMGDSVNANMTGTYYLFTNKAFNFKT